MDDGGPMFKSFLIRSTKLAILFGGLSTARANEGILSLGIEGGYSSAHNIDQKGTQFAIRGAIIDMQLDEGTQKLFVPKEWRATYGRFEQNQQDYRGAIGVGRSVDVIYGGIIGIEGGLIMARVENGEMGGGAEITGLLSAGIIELYLRESMVYTGSGNWQTDIGLRINVPFIPKS